VGHPYCASPNTAAASRCVAAASVGDRQTNKQTDRQTNRWISPSRNKVTSIANFVYGMGRNNDSGCKILASVAGNHSQSCSRSPLSCPSESVLLSNTACSHPPFAVSVPHSSLSYVPLRYGFADSSHKFFIGPFFVNVAVANGL